DVWAAGSYNPTATLEQSLALHWDGTSWTQVSTPNPGTASYVLRGVAAVYGNDVWAVGYSGPSSTRTFTLHWNGTLWSVVPSANVDIDDNWLYGVTATSASNVLAVGSYYNVSSHNIQTLE